MKFHSYLRHFPRKGEPIIGGTAKAVNGLAEGLVENGYDVTILGEGPEDSTYRSGGGVEVKTFRTVHKAPTFFLAHALTEYLSREVKSTDVVLINGSFTPSIFSLSRVLSKLGLRYLAVPHTCYGAELFRKRPYLKWPYWLLFERRVLVDAWGVVNLDERHEADLRRLGVMTKSIVVPNGVSASARQKQIGKYIQQDKKTKLIFFGRGDIHTKGLDLLIEALGSIEVEGLTLTLQGSMSPSVSKRLLELCRKVHVENLVELRTADYATDAVEILREYDIVCLPSRYEGFGLSVLEAMLAERVVLVSNVAGVARHVAEAGCGILVAPQSDKIGEGIRRLLACRQRWREMGEAGRSYVLENLSWKAIAASFVRAAENLPRVKMSPEQELLRKWK